MVLNDEEPPAPYICREDEDDEEEEEDALGESLVPVIDMSRLALSEQESKETLNKIKAALSSWGYFQASKYVVGSFELYFFFFD